MLEQPMSVEDPSPVNAAKAVYKACMNIGHIQREGLQPLVALSLRLGGWPMALERWDSTGYDTQHVIGQLYRLLGLSPLVSAYVYVDRKHSNQSVIMVDQPSLVLPRSMLANPELYYRQVGAYKRWIAHSAWEMSKQMNNAVSWEDVKLEASQVVDFEISVAKITSVPEMRRNAMRTYHAMSVLMLQQWTDSACRDKLNWLRFFNHMLQDVEVTIDKEERVVVKEVDYLFELISLIDHTPQRVVANYLQWRLVASLAEETTKQMRDLRFQFDKVFSGVSEELPRWRDCVAKTSAGLSHAIGYKYVQSHFAAGSKASARTMAEDIRAAFYKHMAQVQWMDVGTNRLAREKAEAVTEFIGYPDWYNNASALLDFYTQVNVSFQHFHNMLNLKSVQVFRSLSKLRVAVDHKEWLTSPDVVNAFYNPMSNSITFPAGILQPPFFNADRLQALNYGSIGVVIGHEITHGFDDMGRQSDKSGNLVQWWSDATVATYLDKAQCFIDQYSYRIPELDHLVRSEFKMNGVITQGENIADNGGLNTAYRAYQEYVRRNGPEPRLPGLEKFSPEQLFFIGFASVWCEASTQESLLNEALTDSHSPHKMRVRGTLSNSEDFSQAFRCPLGAIMNPVTKCHIW